MAVGSGVRVGIFVRVEVSVGKTVGVAVGWVAVGAIVPSVLEAGTVALIITFWFAGQVTGTLAGMVIWQEARQVTSRRAKMTWLIFIVPSF